jgi:hypothetical protein
MSLHRPPISARHAFALAFDLAVRRDPLQSLAVPLLLHTPWLLLQAMLPAPDQPGGLTPRNLFLNSVVLLGEFGVSLLVAAMLRFRARSVFNIPNDSAPAPALECYRRALPRLPWLFVTEVLRNLAMFGAGLFLVLPGVSLATEAAVLRGGHSLAAFGRSFQLTAGRLERWLEMIALSVVMVLTVLFTCALFFFAIPGSSWSTWVTVGLFLLPLAMTLIQYAWTFFYLRLEETEVRSTGGGGLGVGEAAAAAPPRLRLVEGGGGRESGEG